MKKNQLCYSRRHQKYLCIRCAIKLHYLTDKDVSEFLVQSYGTLQPEMMAKSMAKTMVEILA